MQTYKTFKNSNIEGEVEEFLNQDGNVMRIVIVNKKEYSVDLSLSNDEIEEEFFFDFSTTEDSKKAFNLLTK